MVRCEGELAHIVRIAVARQPDRVNSRQQLGRTGRQARPLLRAVRRVRVTVSRRALRPDLASCCGMAGYCGTYRRVARMAEPRVASHGEQREACACETHPCNHGSDRNKWRHVNLPVKWTASREASRQLRR